MTHRIVAFYGPIGAGKTTSAKMLCDYAGAVRVSFADPLRYEVAREFVTDQQTIDHIYAEMMDPATKGKYRKRLQERGSARRAEDPDYWIKAFFASLPTDGTLVVNDDLRYRNEYEALRAANALIIEVAGNPNAAALPADVAQHESERDWPHFTPDYKLLWGSLRYRKLALRACLISKGYV